MRVLSCDVGATAGLCLLEFRGARAFWLGDDSTREPFASSLVVEEAVLDLLVVESVGTVFPRERFCAAMATALKDAGRLAGRFEQYALDRGIPWHETTAREVRGAMCGRANANDRDVDLVVRARVDGLPKRSSSHVRDAALAAIFAVTSRVLTRRSA